MNQDELSQLIDSVIDGDCSESDFIRLEAELHVDRAARNTFYHRLKLHTCLQEESQSRLVSIRQPRIPSSRRTRRSVVAVAAVVALLLLAGLSGWITGRKAPGQPVAHLEPVASGFGVITDQAQARWDTGTLKRGDLVPSGPVRLTSGIAQVELFSGVSLVIEGPAEFELHSDMEMTMKTGKLRANVPRPARGFRIQTETGDVVDLGTEFAIDIGEDHSDFHVLEGEIEWHPISSNMERLTDGDSIRWTRGGQVEPLTGGFETFPDPAQLNRVRLERRARWLSHAESFSQRPGLLAYYPMSRPGGWKRQLRDASPGGRHGAIVRTKRTADRWDVPDQAIEFSPTGSRVRVDIPGEHEALTLFCWVRIDSLDKWYNSLFLTDGHELHEPHWQIMDDGRMFFSVKAREEKGKVDKHIAYSPPIWSPSLSGQWLQLATVYDGKAGTTTHYLNGEHISQDHLPDHFIVDRVRIGAASIGNWSQPMRKDPHFAVRNLNGAIDEFAIFSVALTGEEIANLYQIGKP